MVKFLVNDIERSEEEFNALLEKEVRYQIKETFDEILDDVYEVVKMGSLTFSPSLVLKRCDPIAYDISLNEEACFRLGDVKYDLERGETIEIGEYEFKIEEEEEE